MLVIGQEVDLKIENLASTGKGVGFLDLDTKRAIFVDYSVPGDELKVKITSKKKAYFEAEIITITKPSPSRRKAVCKHFQICGACDFLHIEYSQQIKQKELLLKFQAKKHNLDLGDFKVIEAINEYHYKDKVRKTANGFYKKRSNEIVPIKKCHIINDEFNKSVFESKQDVFVYDYAENKVSDNDGFYFYEELKLKHNVKGFVQSNLKMNTLLIDEVLSNVVGKKVLELYCGNGNFTLPLISKGYEVTAIEGGSLGYELLMENLKENNLTCQTYNLDVTQHTYETYEVDTVILDPPRAGAQSVLDSLNCKRVIYVSCNSDNAMKDIKKSSYKIVKSVLIDMFANTKHFETVFILEKY